MGEKGRTSLYLDRELVTRLVADGWNVSSLVTEALELVDTPEWEDVRILAKIKLLETRKEEVEKELYNSKRRIKALEIENTRLTKDVIQVKEDWEIIKRTTRMQEYIQTLNRVVISAMYNVDEIKISARELIPKIIELNPDFDIYAHVDRLRTVMEY